MDKEETNEERLDRETLEDKRREEGEEAERSEKDALDKENGLLDDEDLEEELID